MPVCFIYIILEKVSRYKKYKTSVRTTCLIPLKNVICLMSSGSFSDCGQWKLSRSGIMLQPHSMAATISCSNMGTQQGMK